MYKLRTLAAILWCHWCHWCHFCDNTVTALFSQSDNTVTTLNDTLNSRLSRLKTPFNSLPSDTSDTTFPNFAQEHEKEDYGRILVDDREPIYHDPYEGDEFDHEDYDEWFYSESWEQRAVNEAIDDEADGEYPRHYDPKSGDIPF